MLSYHGAKNPFEILEDLEGPRWYYWFLQEVVREAKWEFLLATMRAAAATLDLEIEGYRGNSMAVEFALGDAQYCISTSFLVQEVAYGMSSHNLIRNAKASEIQDRLWEIAEQLPETAMFRFARKHIRRSADGASR
jgi:hypothetical protein